MKKLKVKSADFEFALADIPNIVDAVFDPDHDRPGWVIMAANAKGCQHIENLFPHLRIRWRKTGPALPADWREFKINVPHVASRFGTRLPLDVIPEGDSVDDSSPEQLAMLLAFGVKCDGGRAAVVDYTRDALPTVMVFSPPGN
jgi:hypothetical protein